MFRFLDVIAQMVTHCNTPKTAAAKFGLLQMSSKVVYLFPIQVIIIF